MDLSIIIAEYFSLEELQECLSCIYRNVQGLNYEIVVSSNSCYEKTQQEKLQNEFSHVIWIFNEKNLGFAKAINLGIMKSSGNCVLIMNVDVRLLDNNIIIAYRYLMENPQVGVIGPKIIDNDGNLQDSCRKFMTPTDFFARIIKRAFLRKDVLLNAQFNYNITQPVDWVIGAFMMVKRDAIEKVGLLDEGCFLYVEDMDWCKRFWDCGLKVVYYPNLVVEYKGDRKSILPLISQKFINKYSIYHLKSYLRFLRKHLV